MSLSANIDASQRPAVAVPAPLRRWTAWATFGLGLAVIGWVYRETWLSMERVWRGSDTFGHGYLVPLISAWLAWRMRDSIRCAAPRFGWLGVPALALSYLAWLAGELAGVNAVTQLAVVAMIAGWTLLVLGHRATWQLAFPLAFLLFAVPLGEPLEPILMQWTADATVASLRLVGIPVYRDGLHFMLPTGRWSVVEACSGLRYLIAALLLGLLFAHLNYRSWRRKVVFVALAVAIALIANWVRAALIVLLGHVSDMRLGIGADHVWYGWVFFGLVMLAVFYLGSRWREPVETGTSPANAPGSFATAAPNGAPAWAAVASLAVAAALVLGQPLPDRLALTTPNPGFRAEVMGAMQATPLDRLSLEPSYRHAIAEVRGTRRAEPSVELYSAYFADQRVRSEMVHHGNQVLSSSDVLWAVSSTATVEIPDGRGGIFKALEYRVHSGPRRALVWHWFTVAGRPLASPYAVKLATVQAIALGRGDHSSANVLFTDLEPRPGSETLARARLARVATALAGATAAATTASDSR